MRKFLKSSKTTVESLNDFYKSTGYLQNYKEFKWKKRQSPECFCGYFKFTSNLIMYIDYACSRTNYGTIPVAKLKEIKVAFRDGSTEYLLVKERLQELRAERSKVRRSKKLDEEIKWLEYLNKNIKRILPKFTKYFLINVGEKLCGESITVDESKISKSEIASQYVVLDLETNGLRTASDDLLSISLYDPSNGKIYNRLLPLELQPTVLTTYINGIDDTDIADEVPLCQKEFDELIAEFDLTNKTILYYSGGKFDFDFLSKYCRRHKISGIELLRFENIKDRIASSSFTTGNLTKDNLCNALGIGGVLDVHNGVNDCYLEWQLFDKFVCNKLFVKESCIYQFSNDYVVPASYLTSYPNLAEFLNIPVPKLKYEYSLIYEYSLAPNLVKKIKKYPTNISGVAIESAINSMIGAVECDNRKFLCANSKKLKKVGVLPSEYNTIFVEKTEMGTFKALDSKNEKYVEDVNKTSQVIKDGIVDVITFIKEKIFKEQEIRTQELSFAENNRVLALCDLSSDDAVLEIKTFDIFNSRKANSVIRQMYYQKGDGDKDLYAMSIVFGVKYTKRRELRVTDLIFKIYKVKIEKDDT